MRPASSYIILDIKCTSADQAFVWARRRTLDDGSRAWLFRVVHPNHTITNGKKFMRIKDVNQTPLRDLQRAQPWDFSPMSTEFRRRMKKMHRRMQQHRAALEPDVQLHVEHWATKEQFEGTDEFKDHWVHLAGLDDARQEPRGTF